MSLLSPQLQAFFAVANCKTVHGAAALIHITQTAVTQRIRSLEKQLQTSLFIRSKKGMLLTSEGQALLRYCHAASELEGDTISKIHGAAIKTEILVTICAPSSMMKSRIIQKCMSIRSQFPQLLFKFEVNDLENRHQLLKSGKCDLAVIHPEDCAKEMTCKKLKLEEYILVCSPKWKNRKLQEIISTERIIDFNEEDRNTFNYLKYYNLFHLARHDRYFVNNTDLLAWMIINDHGYTTLTKELSEEYIEKSKMISINQNKTYEHTYLLAWYPRPELPEYFSAIINAID
ncbi:MAG: LysR family transcriptional regulator [Bdellovibrionota bacterium]